MSRIPAYYQRRMPKVDTMAQIAEAVASLLVLPRFEASRQYNMAFRADQVQAAISSMEDGLISDEDIWEVGKRLPRYLPGTWVVGFGGSLQEDGVKIFSVGLLRVGEPSPKES